MTNDEWRARRRPRIARMARMGEEEGNREEAGTTDPSAEAMGEGG